MIIDDSIEEKTNTDENEIICWHYDHAKDCTVKSINFITALYEVNGISLPVNFRLVSKTNTTLTRKADRNAGVR